MTKAAIIKLIILYSNLYGVDSKLALSIAEIESNFNPAAIGEAGELGLFQVKPQYVKELTKKQLLDPIINIKVGLKKLIEAKEKCIHKNEYDWVVCYNYGITAAKHVKYPSLFPYVVRVKQSITEYENSYEKN